LRSKVEEHVEGAAAVKEGSPLRVSAPVIYYKGQGKTLADFASLLEGQLHKPVTDATGLNGKYDFNIWWVPENLDADPTAVIDAPTLRPQFNH
jgi:uncharacterized protein (TIGR03435 family)